MLTRPRLRSHTGCIPCKTRRKKCDEQKPICGACQRVNRRCSWISEQGNGTGHSLAKHSDPVFEYFIKRLRQEPTLSKGVDLSAFRDRICASHALEVCFKSSNSSFDPMNSQRNGWSIQSTLTFAPMDQSLSWDCFLAHGLMFVGNRYNDWSLLEAGLIKYCLLVRRLRTVIEDEDKRCDFDALAAVHNLGIFSATRSWNNQIGSVHDSLGVGHAAGMLAILETMQPEQFQDDRALAFFEHTRFTKVATAILSKRETCLTSERWKTVPWTQVKHSKDSMHRLIDLLCDMVCLQSELYILTPYQEFSFDLSTSWIQGKVQVLLIQLRSWRQCSESRLRSRLDAKGQAAKASSSLGNDSSLMLLDKAMCLCELGIFNMMLIYLCRFLTKDGSFSRTADPSINPSRKGFPELRLASRMMPLDLPIEDPSRRAYMAATEIVVIWEVMLRNDLIGLATIYLGLPMLLARALLTYQGDEVGFIVLDKALGQLPTFWSGTG